MQTRTIQGRAVASAYDSDVYTKIGGSPFFIGRYGWKAFAFCESKACTVSERQTKMPRLST